MARANLGAIVTAFFLALRSAFEFQGRSSRSGLWGYTIKLTVVLVVAAIIDRSAGTGSAFLILALLAHVLPTLSIFVRRLHDLDLSGWMLLVVVIPYVGIVLALVLYLVPGRNVASNYGAPLDWSMAQIRIEPNVGVQKALNPERAPIVAPVELSPRLPVSVPPRVEILSEPPAPGYSVQPPEQVLMRREGADELRRITKLREAGLISEIEFLQLRKASSLG